MSRALVARLDGAGDVLLSGPAVRAVAAARGPVVYVAGRAGAPAAALLPGVDEVIELDAPWVSFDPPPVDGASMRRLVREVAARGVDEAIVLTSFHQSPLPLALLLRLAGVRRIAATCVDYPGSLLDVRVAYDPSLHEVEQALAVCAAAGMPLPAEDTPELRLDLAGPATTAAGAGIGGPDAPAAVASPYVVVHPGASVPARALPPAAARSAVQALVRDGWRVVVTGTPSERQLVDVVAGGPSPMVTPVTGAGFAGFASLVAGASAVVCGNTSAAHVAAATATPAVVAFAPVVPAHRWRPWAVRHVLLGVPDIGCAGCRSRACPVPGQPCLRPFTPAAVVAAVRALVTPGAPDAEGAEDADAEGTEDGVACAS